MAQDNEGNTIKTGGNAAGDKRMPFPGANPNTPWNDPQFMTADGLLEHKREQLIQQLQIDRQRGLGRPVEYSALLAVEICEKTCEGYTLKQICRLPGMPAIPTVHQWLTYSQDFAFCYARASQIKLLGYADDIVEIADDGRNDWMERERKDGGIEMVPNQENVNRSRLRVDTLKWILTKLLPKIFGDKVLLEVTDNYADLLAKARHRIKARKEKEDEHAQAIEGELVPLPESVTEDDIAADAADHE